MVSGTTRVWFITGASAGLGMALTRSILARGDYVIASSRSLKPFDELRQDPNIDQTRLRFLTLDVTSPFGEIKKCIDEALTIWGRIDVLVNNAGTCTFGVAEELGAEGVMKEMKTNFFGPINVTNAVLPSMRERRDGTVIFIGSRSAYRTSIPGTSTYSSSKAAIHAYAETLSVELEQFNIRVTIAAPGTFSTKINTPTRAGAPLAGYEALRDRMDKFLPNYAKIPKGNPDLGMSALVDVVRREGRAAGRGPAPLWLFLGEDSIRDVRKRTQAFHSVLEEWEDVGTNLGLPQEEVQA